MRCTVPSPAAGYGQKYTRGFRDKGGLLLGCEHQVAITLLLCCERGEDAPAYAKIRRAEVRALFGPFEAESEPAEIISVHGENQLSVISWVPQSLP
jgi:hypothetical protein